MGQDVSWMLSPPPLWSVSQRVHADRGRSCGSTKLSRPAFSKLFVHKDIPICIPVPLKFCPNLQRPPSPFLSVDHPVQLVLKHAFVKRLHVETVCSRERRHLACNRRHYAPERYEQGRNVVDGVDSSSSTSCEDGPQPPSPSIRQGFSHDPSPTAD